MLSFSPLQLYSEMLPPAPVFTEKDLPSLSAKVYIVTGGASGVGLELCKVGRPPHPSPPLPCRTLTRLQMLYSKCATVYIAGRSQPNADAAIAAIRQASPASTGALHFLLLDLSDLRSVKPAALAFLALESRLDVVWHNAGIMIPANGSTDAQVGSVPSPRPLTLTPPPPARAGPRAADGHQRPRPVAAAALPHAAAARHRRARRHRAGQRAGDLGTFFPARQTDRQTDTARTHTQVASVGTLMAPPGGINWADINWETSTPTGLAGLLSLDGRAPKYAQSKAANIILAHEAAKRWAGSGVVSLVRTLPPSPPRSLHTNRTHRA